MSAYASCFVRCLVASLAFAPAAAFAGAWTQPEGDGQIIVSIYGWSGAGAPYGGTAASESRIEAQTMFEYGLYERLTLFGEISGERYSLSAPAQDIYKGLDYSSLGLRGRVWSDDASVFSLEASGYVPGARDPLRPAQAGDTGGAAEIRALAGHNLVIGSMPAFVDAEAGFRLRSAGPPDEWRGDLTLGARPWPRMTVLLQSFNTISAGAGGAALFRLAVRQPRGEPGLCARLALVVTGGAFATLATVNANTQRGAVIAVWRKF